MSSKRGAVAMTSSVGSVVDPTASEVIDACDGSMGARPVDGECCEDAKLETKVIPSLPTLAELPDYTPDEWTEETSSAMPRSDTKARPIRPGRKYKPASVQPFGNGHHEQIHHQTGVGVGNKTASPSSSPSSSPRNWQSSLRNGPNDSTTPWKSSLASPRIQSTPRSPRLPRRLPSITRSDSQESATNFDVDVGDFSNKKENASGLKDESLDNADAFSANPISPRPLPTSSIFFQKIMTDFHDRPSSSLDTSGPGDLMVRRSSLVRTTLSPPLLQIKEVPDDELSGMSDLGLDIELAPPPGSVDDHDEKTQVGESTSHSFGNNKEQNNCTNKDMSLPVCKINPDKLGKNHVKTTSPRRPLRFSMDSRLSTCPINGDDASNRSQSVCKVNEDSENNNHIKTTSPRRPIRLSLDSSLSTCVINGDDATEKGIVISVPTADSLQSTASPRLRRRSRLRSREATTSISGDSCTGSSEMSSSPDRSSNPRRKISEQHNKHRQTCPINPVRNQHNHIDMKTAGNIIKFITAASASSKAPGLNRNQQLLPSDVRLPVVDPSGRLLHRNRDESMRLVKQAVDLNVESDEKSDVYSWDELRDCRYLRTKKNSRESRRNSLLGFNEI
ncbi:uncharacterized protein LOC121423507 [Lytechinus variegatus]|uniref:uncharacterized protein LOC121423507 n=1 Tax=Lytechinus variegatus TaxID=7654 RepID=UPI001BB270A8|nr:uncharacterized protein LOC121423507 [Lytechinus variegatus]